MHPFSIGDVIVGFGLHNAGLSYTVLALGRPDRIKLEGHLTGNIFWTNATYYRLDSVPVRYA